MLTVEKLQRFSKEHKTEATEFSYFFDSLVTKEKVVKTVENVTDLKMMHI